MGESETLLPVCCCNRDGVLMLLVSRIWNDEYFLLVRELDFYFAVDLNYLS